MLYVVNVEACIHQENYGIFFYEPAAKQKIELFEAKWTFESLTDVFSQIAAAYKPAASLKIMIIRSSYV